MPGRPGPKGTWSSDDDLTLRKRLKDGYPAREIGKELGKSRNAVIGRAFRLGLIIPRRKPKPKWPTKLKPPSPPKRIAMPLIKKVVPTALTPKKPIPPEPLPEDCWKPLPGTLPLTILELREDTCRWPIDGMLYCGLPTPDKASYCTVHAGIARRGWFAVKAGLPAAPN